MTKGFPRRAKTDRRQKRLEARRAARASAALRKAEEEATEEAEDLAALDPLAPLLAERGPLAALRFDLSSLPEDAPSPDKAGSLAKWFVHGLPQLAHPAWRDQARAACIRLKAEVLSTGGEGAAHHPDAEALTDALFWLSDDVSTGIASIHNVLFRFIFDQTCSAEQAAGRLPAWVGRVVGKSAAEVRRDTAEQRRDRAAQRLALGPFQDDLQPDEMPTASAMISGPALSPADFAPHAAAAADQDLTPERRAAIAARLETAARREEGAGHALAAFDIRTLAQALESDDPTDHGLARLYYARSVYKRREHATAADSEWPAG